MVFDEGDGLRSDQEERRREKFSRERGDTYMDRSAGRRGFGTDNRRDFSNGVGRKRPFRDDDGGLHAKRSRFDGASDSYEPQFVRRDEPAGSAGAVTQLLTFKKFLATQDESLTDEEAVAKYAEYKTEFMRQECDRYFQAHKDEEWFRLKYHPEEGRERRQTERENMQMRLQVFKELMEKGCFQGLAVSYEHAEQLIRLLDTVVIKLEGGTAADIETANEEPIWDESVLDLLSSEQLKQYEADKKAKESSAKLKEEEAKKNEASGTEEENAAAADGDENMVVEQKPSTKRTLLHKTCSVHFRSVPSSLPLADLENLCKQHPGFIRLAITDPVTNSKGQQMRAAWATYRWDVNIKVIFWALHNAKLNGMDLGVSINREPRRRVRTIGATSGLASHRTIVQNDIRQAAKLVVLFDMKAGYYREEAEEGEDQGQGGVQDDAKLADLEAAVLRSANPLLANISQHLVEETSAEEESLLEKPLAAVGQEISQEMEQDKQMTETLDMLILYLRIVHSVDFYAATDYPLEDNMPHRLALFHVRGRPPHPSNDQREHFAYTERDIPLLPKSVVDAHIQTFNARLEQALLKKAVLAETELQKLGKKDPEKAVDEFVNANTQQLGPDKWLCPLSGKKFKGAEFVQKHIQSKYQTEMNNARHDTLYFNNFLADPSRPHNPIYAKSSVMSPRRTVERSLSPVPHRRSSAAADDVGGRQVAEATSAERTPYQRSTWQPPAGDRFSGGNRFGGGGRQFGGGGGFGGGGRPRQFNNEPMNETMGPGGRGGGKQDPRAPPSYRDLDAPEDIF